MCYFLTPQCCPFSINKPQLINIFLISALTLNRISSSFLRLSETYSNAQPFSSTAIKTTSLSALILSLAYSSKNESQWDRALRQRNKQRRRLSGNAGLEAYMAQKPKGMWWRTYQRLQERAYEAEQRSDDEFIVMARRFVRVG